MTEASSTKVLNVKSLSIISNSSAEFCIYTYKAITETDADLKREGFFNPGYSVFNPGDILRVMFYEDTDIAKYYEFLIVEVDKDFKKVKAAVIHEYKLEGRLVGKETTKPEGK